MAGKHGSDDDSGEEFHAFVNPPIKCVTKSHVTHSAAQIAAELIAKLSVEMEADKRRCSSIPERLSKFRKW